MNLSETRQEKGIRTRRLRELRISMAEKRMSLDAKKNGNDGRQLLCRQRGIKVCDGIFREKEAPATHKSATATRMA